MTNMNESNLLLQVIATGLAGYVAGGTLYISAVEAPGRSTLDPSTQLMQWRSTFPRAKNVFFPSSVTLVPLLGAAAYVTSTPLLYAAAVPFGLMAPFSSIFLSSTNKRLLTMSDQDRDQDGGTEVRWLISRWASRHAVRSGLTTIGFGLCLLSLARKLMAK